MTHDQMLNKAFYALLSKVNKWVNSDLGDADYFEYKHQLFSAIGLNRSKIRYMTKDELKLVYDACQLYNYYRENEGNSHSEAIRAVALKIKP
jgi:hypothetical protein